MARTFSLSANIENGFAEGMQYLVTPNAKNAIHNIVNDFHSGIHSFTIIGSYGTGKSSFLLALEADLKKTSKKRYLLDPKNLSDAKAFEIMKAYGAEKILFGTDYPMKTPEEELEILFGLGFSERELDLITHLNAEKIFGINTYAVEYPFPL